MGPPATRRNALRLAAAALAGSLVAAGCASPAPGPGPGPKPKGPGFTACEAPRPEICTREYQPVCALRDAEGRCAALPCDSAAWRTYPNACEACSDPRVLGYRAGGTCEDQ
jgi:hypothetical protein